MLFYRAYAACHEQQRGGDWEQRRGGDQSGVKRGVKGTENATLGLKKKKKEKKNGSDSLNTELHELRQPTFPEHLVQ